MSLDSETLRLAIMPRGGLFSGRRLGVAPRVMPKTSYRVLTALDGESITRQEVVQLVPVAEVPERCLAIGGELSARLGIGPDEMTRWRIEPTELRHVLAQEVQLEVQVETQLEEIVDQLNGTRDLAGKLLWLGPHQQADGLWMEVDGTPYRIREVQPPPASDTVVEIRSETRLSLFAPQAKAGVDIVVLADCSGSMNIGDLTETVEGPTGLVQRFMGSTSKSVKPLRRIEALKRSLMQLLDLRLRSAGRLSHIALVSFTDVCNASCIRFPRDGQGMMEIDGNSTPALIQSFRDAVNTLRASGATNICEALHFAAELLHRHGHPGNERLVVLVSDGAHWEPESEKQAGREIGGLEDPVSLMEHLHSSMSIHLHPIGISDETIFQRYLASGRAEVNASVGHIPNLDLLKQLVAVGGGHPSQTGDASVLHKYFTGLGQGISRTLRSPTSASIPALTPDERRLLQEAGQQSEQLPPGYDTSAREQIRDRIIDLYNKVNQQTQRLVGQPLFQYQNGFELLARRLFQPVRSADEFRLFILDVVIATLDEVHPDVKQDFDARRNRDVEPAEFEIPELVSVYGSTEAQDLRKLRRGHSQGDLSDRDHVDFGNILLRLIGTAHIDPRQTALWAKLHLAVMQQFETLLQRFAAGLEKEESIRREARQPDVGTQPDPTTLLRDELLASPDPGTSKGPRRFRILN